MRRHLRLPREGIFLIAYVLLVTTLCLLIIVDGVTARFLSLLMWPIIFAAMFYRRRLYLALLAVAVSGSGITRVYTSSQQSFAWQELLQMFLVLLVAVEIIYWLACRRRQTEHTLRNSVARYQLLVDQSLTSLYRIELDGTLVECNQALVYLFGYDTREQVVGRNTAMWYVDQAEQQCCIAQVLQQGLLVDAEIRMLRRDGTMIWALKSATRVDNECGMPIAIVGTLIDISERKHAQGLQRFLAEANAMLASSFDSEHTLRNVAAFAVSQLADWCTVAVHKPGSEPRRVALVCADPTKQWLADEMKRYPLRADAPHLIPKVLRTGTSELVPEIVDEDLAAVSVDERHLALLRQMGLRSAITVPLLVRGKIIGALSFMRAESGQRYQTTDLAALEDFAGRVADAINNAQLYHEAQRRLTELMTVQQVARMINSSLQLADIFKVVVTQISSAFGYRLVSIYLLQGDLLHLQAHVGYREVLQTIPVTEGISGQVVRSGQPAFIQDASNEPNFLFAASGITQAIIVPLKHDDQVLGSLAVEADGEPILADDDYMLLTLLADQVSIAVANAQLFTALQASEQRYRASEERYRLLADNSLDLIKLLDLDGNVLYASPSHKHVLGYTTEQMLSTNIFQLTHPDERPALHNAIQHVLSYTVNSIIELRLLHHNGSWVITEDLVSVITDSAGITRLLISAREITARKRTEEASRQLERKMLETQKLESLGMLAGGIAHDFNNLLTAILGYTQLALLDLAAGMPAYESVLHVEQAVQRAADLTRQMLAYAGKGRFTIEQVNLNSIVQEMTTLFNSSITKMATLQYELAPYAVVLMADATQMRQVVTNLVINAAEALSENTGIIIVRTGIRRGVPDTQNDDHGANELPANTYLYLEVEDTGHGMDAETQAKIFEPFFTTKFTGRGLGLAAVLGIIRGHGGNLVVKSQPGVGTTFTVLLPLPEDARPPNSQGNDAENTRR